MADQQNTAANETIEDILHEQLGFVRGYAGIAQQYIELGDRPGFNHSMRQLIARVKVVAGISNDISKRADLDGGSE